MKEKALAALQNSHNLWITLWISAKRTAQKPIITMPNNKMFKKFTISIKRINPIKSTIFYKMMLIYSFYTLSSIMCRRLPTISVDNFVDIGLIFTDTLVLQSFDLNCLGNNQWAEFCVYFI